MSVCRSVAARARALNAIRPRRYLSLSLSGGGRCLEETPCCPPDLLSCAPGAAVIIAPLARWTWGGHIQTSDDSLHCLLQPAPDRVWLLGVNLRRAWPRLGGAFPPQLRSCHRLMHGRE